MSLVISKPFILGYCNCGCLEEISIKNKRNVLGRFKKFHNPKGENNSNYKHGKAYDRRGYTSTLIHEHPYRNSHGQVGDHRLVLEDYYTKKWGYRFYIHPSLDVHHINGNPSDNRIENLMIVTHKQHRLIHALERIKDKTDWFCSRCNKKTYVRKNGREDWHYDSERKRICSVCYDKEIWITKKRCLEHDNRRKK